MAQINDPIPSVPTMEQAYAGQPFRVIPSLSDPATMVAQPQARHETPMNWLYPPSRNVGDFDGAPRSVGNFRFRDYGQFRVPSERYDNTRYFREKMRLYTMEDVFGNRRFTPEEGLRHLAKKIDNEKPRKRDDFERWVNRNHQNRDWYHETPAQTQQRINARGHA